MPEHPRPASTSRNRSAVGGCGRARSGAGASPAARLAARSGRNGARPSTPMTASGCAVSPNWAGAGRVERGRTAARRPNPAADVWLLFAPIKRARLDWLDREGDRTRGRRTRSRYGPRAANQSKSTRTGCAEWRLPRPSKASACRFREILAASLLVRDHRRLGPTGDGLILCDETDAGSPVAATLAGAGGRGALPRCLSDRKAGSPKRSLTLSVNFPLLRESGSARGCCAPRPRLSPPWRFFRRSPATWAGAGRAELTGVNAN